MEENLQSIADSLAAYIGASPNTSPQPAAMVGTTRASSSPLPAVYEEEEEEENHAPRFVENNYYCGSTRDEDGNRCTCDKIHGVTLCKYARRPDGCRDIFGGVGGNPMTCCAHFHTPLNVESPISTLCCAWGKNCQKLFVDGDGVPCQRHSTIEFDLVQEVNKKWPTEPAQTRYYYYMKLAKEKEIYKQIEFQYKMYLEFQASKITTQKVRAAKSGIPTNCAPCLKGNKCTFSACTFGHTISDIGKRFAEGNLTACYIHARGSPEAAKCYGIHMTLDEAKKIGTEAKKTGKDNKDVMKAMHTAECTRVSALKKPVSR